MYVFRAATQEMASDVSSSMTLVLAICDAGIFTDYRHFEHRIQNAGSECLE